MEKSLRIAAMFTLIECLRSALISIRAHGFRSLLTTLGIIIGVASVIATVAIVQGLSYSITQQLQGLGATSLSVYSYTPFQEQMKGRFARITPDDLQLITDRVDGIESITPILASHFSSTIRYGSKSTFTRVQGTTKSFQQVQQLYMTNGRFLADSDNQTRRRVCVIGEEVRSNLSLPKNPVGEFIEISGEWVKIVGLVEAKGDLLGFKQDDFILLPYSTMRSLNGNQVEADIQIQLTVNNIEEMDAVTERIRRLLRQSHRITDGDDDFKIQSAEQLKSSITRVTSSITLVMGGIVGISLLVGGIGIMSIM